MTALHALRFGLMVGISTALLALAPATAAEAQTFSWTVNCPVIVVGPVTVLANNYSGTVALTANTPVTIALLPTNQITQVNNPAAAAGTFTGSGTCTLTFGGVTVPFTLSFSLNTGNGQMTTAAISVVVNLGSLGTVSISAPATVTIGFDKNLIPNGIIAVPLNANTTVLLTPSPIPTLSTWAWMILLALLLGSALVFLQRRARAV